MTVMNISMTSLPQDGKSALHLAAEAGHKEATDLLLDYTANPNSETIVSFVVWCSVV